MEGPFPTGTHDPALFKTPLSWCEQNRETGVYLKRGSRYRVIREFVDGDGTVHRIGDEWVFVASSFGIYDGVALLFIRDNWGDEWRIPLYENDKRQRIIIETFGRFVTELFDPAADGWMPPL